MSSMFGQNKYARGNVDDTGWVDLGVTGSNMTTYLTTAPLPQVRKIGSVVYFQGQASPTTTNTIYSSSMTATNLILTLPVEYRPKSIDQIFLCQGSGVVNWALAVRSDGNCYATRYGDGVTVPSNATWLPWSVSWAV
jgi:hypothetical protein